jgi:hypothetical protein
MATRVLPNVARFETDEVVPEHLCQWDASGVDNHTAHTLPIWADELTSHSVRRTWWVEGWVYMYPYGKVIAPIHVVAPAHVLDKFFEPPTNEWGEVSP